MRELFIAECRRLLKGTLVVAVVHAMLMLFAFRAHFFALEQPSNAQIGFLFLYTLVGIGFAITQIGSYRQPNRWLWLMHRPLPRLAIFGAIALSAVAMLAIAIGLPVLLTVAGIDAFTARPVDLRYYAYVPYLVMVCAIAWLVGAAVMLNRSRFAFLAMFLPFVIVLNEAKIITTLLATVATVAILAAFVYTSFKSDRAAAPEGKFATVFAAAPLVLGFYYLLYLCGSALLQVGMTAFAMHPMTMSTPPPGGYVEANRAEPRALLLAGLASSGDARAAHWRKQLALTDVAMVYPGITRHAVPQQMSNTDIMHFNNPDKHIDYVFDHAAMRFKGIDSMTGAHRGWAGQGGVDSEERFATIPVIRDGYILTQQLALTLDPASGRYLERVRLPDGERILAAPKKIADRFYLLSNRRLLVYVANAAEPEAPYVQLYTLTWPTPLGDETFVNIAPLLDGTLVSTTNLNPRLVGEAGTAQLVYFVDQDGHQHTVAQRKLIRDFPLVFEHDNWIISPLIHSINSSISLLMELSGGKNYANYDTIELPRPPQAWIAALLLMLLSGAIAWQRKRSATWALACTLIGLPALATMIVLNTNKPKD
jgi:hypothetical protein